MFRLGCVFLAFFALAQAAPLEDEIKSLPGGKGVSRLGSLVDTCLWTLGLICIIGLLRARMIQQMRPQSRGLTADLDAAHWMDSFMRWARLLLTQTARL